MRGIKIQSWSGELMPFLQYLFYQPKAFLHIFTFLQFKNTVFKITIWLVKSITIVIKKKKQSLIIKNSRDSCSISNKLNEKYRLMKLPC